MPRSLGPNQIAVCMRSGAKCLASQLVRDGRNPALLVLPEWADPADPLEQPFRPENIEGKARFPISPENLLPFTPPILDADIQSEAPLELLLHWSELETQRPPPVKYDLYRTTDGGVAVLIFSGPVVYDMFGALVSQTLEFLDAAVDALHTYTYRVEAVDSLDHAVSSNTISLVFGVLDTGLLYLRITEDEFVRLTQDDAAREVSR